MRITAKDIFLEIVYLSYSRRYATDGVIYSKPHGGTWHKFAVKKADIPLQQWIENRKAQAAEREGKGLDTLARKFRAIFGDDSWKAKGLYETLDDDLDGIWSELNMFHESYTMDDVKQGSRIYLDYFRLSNPAGYDRLMALREKLLAERLAARKAS